MVDADFNECCIFSHPHAFLDKRNEPIFIMPLDENKRDQLRSMYLERVPRNSFNGLPPIRDELCAKWVDDMIDNGTNLIAVCFEKGVVGHVALFMMDKKTCEMITVVSPGYQYRGIGTQLTRCITQLAYEAGFEKIWLSVEARNHIARHVYLKCGFEYLTQSQIDELDMAFDLQRYRSAAHLKVSEIMNRDIISVSMGVSCKYALDLFLKNHIGALPVVDGDNKVVGILSKTDLIMEVNFQQRVSDIMTREVITVHDSYTLDKVIRICQSRKFRCFPVVDKYDKLIGIIGRKDILAYYHRNL